MQGTGTPTKAELLPRSYLQPSASGLSLEPPESSQRSSFELLVPPKIPAAYAESHLSLKGSTRTVGDEFVAELPINNLMIVMPCLGLVLFLAALDQTIVATALPTIAEEFKASPSQYSWVITSYQLSTTLLTPVNGRVSDVIGRKPMLYAAIVIFTIFSAMCGAAQNIEWLIISRALQGLGGGTITGLCNVVVCDIVPMQNRGKYIGYLGAAWGVSSVLGPILGGIFTTHLSWRWCFYINIPVAVVAFILLVLKLNLNKPKKASFSDLRKNFDFIGLFLVMTGASTLIVGFSFAADHSFHYDPAVILITVGGILMGFAVINCLVTSRMAVIPARMFKTRTTLFYLIASTLQAAAFIPLNFLLPQFFQGVHGADAFQSGLQLLSFAVVAAVVVVLTGIIQTRFKCSRPLTWAGYTIGGGGCALLYVFFNYDIPLGLQHGLLIVLATGMGASLQTTLLILQCAMPLAEMAAVTSAWVLSRSLGGTVGVSVLTAVLNTSIRDNFKVVFSNFGNVTAIPTDAGGYKAMKEMVEGPAKHAALAAFANSFKLGWLICAIFMGACLIITLPTKSYSTKRPQGAAAAQVKAEADAELARFQAPYETPYDRNSTHSDESMIGTIYGRGRRTESLSNAEWWEVVDSLEEPEMPQAHRPKRQSYQSQTHVYLPEGDPYTPGRSPYSPGRPSR